MASRATGHSLRGPMTPVVGGIGLARYTGDVGKAERIDAPANVGEDDSLRAKIVGAAMWVPGLAWLVPMMGTMIGLQTVLSPERLDPVNRLYTRGQIWATGTRLRNVVDPRVDPATPYLFCANHTNLLDHATFYAGTPHFKQGVELEEHFRLPVYGWFMRQRGTIPVKKRAGSARRALEELAAGIEQEVARGHSLLVFPEGTRTLDGRVGRFQSGIFRIAIQLGLPVVPTAAAGMFEVMRKGSYRISPGRAVTVYFDAPIETTGLSSKDAPALAKRVRDQVAARVDATGGTGPSS